MIFSDNRLFIHKSGVDERVPQAAGPARTEFSCHRLMRNFYRTAQAGKDRKADLTKRFASCMVMPYENSISNE
jgi:hypothetical protein